MAINGFLTIALVLLIGLLLYALLRLGNCLSKVEKNTRML